jgi:hypothetical protein
MMPRSSAMKSDRREVHFVGEELFSGIYIDHSVQGVAEAAATL